jgi:pimeloyl-ACP methyl ester carboxylesterase
MDPAVFAVGAPDMPGLLGRAKARVVLARGEHDAMVADEHLTRFATPVVTLSGVGHNAHVESPEAVLRLCLAAAVAAGGRLSRLDGQPEPND